MQTPEGLTDLLTLKQLDEATFEGENYQTIWKRVYGGQVLAQALHAAHQTVPSDRSVHSLHGYFILPGDIKTSINYKVDRLRDGGSFTTRRVTAFQNEKAIFVLAASFHIEQKGLEQHSSSPAAAAPEDLLSDADLLKKTDDMPDRMKLYLLARHPFAFEFRPEKDYSHLVSPYENRNIWFKLKKETVLSPQQQQEFLAYAVDYDLLVMSVMAHYNNDFGVPLQVASLDHAMWFHRPFDVNEWLLFSMDSPNVSGARCLGKGSIFDRKGNLVATVIQEGLARPFKLD
ncbi:MAG: acyl-CoA thioesterase [Flavobacteriaceae bacterium]